MRNNSQIIDLIKDNCLEDARKLIFSLYGRKKDEAYYNYYMGLCCYSEKNLSLALKHFQMAEKHGLDTGVLYYNIGVIMLEKLCLEKAKMYFKKAIHSNNLMRDAYQNLAYIYIKQGNLYGAYRTLKTCTSLIPNENLQGIQDSLLTKILKSS